MFDSDVFSSFIDVKVCSVTKIMSAKVNVVKRRAVYRKRRTLNWRKTQNGTVLLRCYRFQIWLSSTYV